MLVTDMCNREEVERSEKRMVKMTGLAFDPEVHVRHASGGFQ